MLPKNISQSSSFHPPHQPPPALSPILFKLPPPFPLEPSRSDSLNLSWQQAMSAGPQLPITSEVASTAMGMSGHQLMHPCPSIPITSGLLMTYGTTSPFPSVLTSPLKTAYLSNTLLPLTTPVSSSGINPYRTGSLPWSSHLSPASPNFKHQSPSHHVSSNSLRSLHGSHCLFLGTGS